MKEKLQIQIPQIFYWKWQENDEKTILHKAADIVKRSRFTHIYVSMHNLPEEDRLLSSQKSTDALKKCAEFFRQHGIGIICDVDFTREAMYVKSNQLPVSGFMKCFTGALDADGAAQIDAPEAEEIINCFAVMPGKDGQEFATSADIGEFAGLKDGKLSVCAGKAFANGKVISYLYKARKGYPDLFSNEYMEGTRMLFEAVKEVPLAGAATDELGLGFDGKVEYKMEQAQVRSMDHLDIHKVNYFAEWFPYSEGMNARYLKQYGSSLREDVLYFWHQQEKDKGRSIRIVNQYLENIRTRMSEVEESIYNLTKEYMGKDAFVGAHTTWWGDELDNNFDAYHNGLDWWDAKRDYAQTDEQVIIPIRLGIARKSKYHLWYNMWYSMRTMDIRSYYRETYCNAIYGGRTHHLGYECAEPGVVLELKQPGYLEKIAEMEDKIKELNVYQEARPDSRILIVFGYEAVTNHYISDPKLTRIERRGTLMHRVLKITQEIFRYPYLCELIPSTELEGDSFQIQNGKAVYYGHEYDAVVFLYPEGITRRVYEVLQQMYEKNVNLMVSGDLSVFHDGTKAENLFDTHCFYHREVSAERVIADLKSLSIPQNHGNSWCFYEDGSITVSNPGADLSKGNGVAYQGRKYDADILYISADGTYHKI